MISNSEFETILNDATKRIEGDISWKPDPEGSPGLEFRAEIVSDTGWPLFAKGRYNPRSGKLTYVIVHPNAGRIYGLDLGAEHHNPDCNDVGDPHKHRWTEAFRDKQAYIPDDITGRWDDPVTVWQQFCTEANIRHNGRMLQPPVQEELPL
jgi:hypothetical protein